MINLRFMLYTLYQRNDTRHSMHVSLSMLAYARHKLLVPLQISRLITQIIRGEFGSVLALEKGKATYRFHPFSVGNMLDWTQSRQSLFIMALCIPTHTANFERVTKMGSPRSLQNNILNILEDKHWQSSLEAREEEKHLKLYWISLKATGTSNKYVTNLCKMRLMKSITYFA